MSEEYEWQLIALPRSMMMGPEAKALHYLEVGESWKVYIVEPPVYEEMHESDECGEYVPAPCCAPPVRWTVAFDGHGIVNGELKTVETAKRTALIILEALSQGPPPEVPDEGGFVIPRPFGGRGGGGGMVGH